MLVWVPSSKLELANKNIALSWYEDK
jgi:hypothetical protein